MDYPSPPIPRWLNPSLEKEDQSKLLLFSLISLLSDSWWFSRISLHISCFFSPTNSAPRELLRGPLFYVLALLVSAVFFWRDSPIGMISLAMMCGGDGKFSYQLYISLFLGYLLDWLTLFLAFDTYVIYVVETTIHAILIYK